MVNAELAGAERSIRKDTIMIGISSFLAGSGVTFTVTLLVHPLH
jgi:hypothetical protein